MAYSFSGGKKVSGNYHSIPFQKLFSLLISGFCVLKKLQATGKFTICKLAIAKLAIGKLAIGKIAIGKLAIGKLAFGKLAIGKLAIGKLVIFYFLYVPK